MSVIRNAETKRGSLNHSFMKSRRELIQLSAGAGITRMLAEPGSSKLASTESRATPSFWIDVKDFGATADGTKDNTSAFQRALDQAHRAGGGMVCAGPGRYLFRGSLIVPDGVTLRGSFGCVPSHVGLRDRGQVKPGEDGTALLALSGRGDENGTAFVSLNSNSCVSGLTIYHPEQNPVDVPVPYPWTISMRGKNPAVLDVELLNSYQGIDASQNERHNVRNVTGQILRRGIWVDDILDIGRLENIHFNPWWSTQPRLYEWQRQHGEAFIFGRADWEYVLNTFCFAYKTGYKFVETATGVCNGNFVGIGADNCHRCVLVEQCAEYGLLMVNAEFTSFQGDDPTMVEVLSSNAGVLRIANSAFWGPCRQIAKIAGKGTVGFSDCTFVQWAEQYLGTEQQYSKDIDPPVAAIQATGGSLLVNGCEFRADKPQIFLGENVERAVISSNLFVGRARIQNSSHHDVQIGLNSAS